MIVDARSRAVSTLGWMLLGLGGWMVGSAVVALGLGALLRRHGVATRDTEGDGETDVK